jgi:hypothetical protein
MQILPTSVRQAIGGVLTSTAEIMHMEGIYQKCMILQMVV